MINLRLQSFPTLGSGQRHLLCSSHIEFPGHSASFLQVTTAIHLTLGSGSGIVPSGHSHLYDPGMFLQAAPGPHLFGFEHSSKSIHCLDGSPVNPGGQLHEYPPGVFEQIESTPHRPDGP